MKTNEMKKVNEDILAKWKGCGLLNGLKEGSTNEWRCAKSFDEMAIYCLANNTTISGSFGVMIFPIVRRALCTGKNRLTRIVQPEEIIKVLSETTVSEAFDIIERTIPIKGTTGLKSVSRRLLRNFCEKICISSGFEKLTCFELLNISDEDFAKKVKFFKDITDCDFEAKMCIIYSEVIKDKLNANK